MTRKHVHNNLEVLKLMCMTFEAGSSFHYYVEKHKDYLKVCKLKSCFNAADFLSLLNLIQRYRD